MFFSPKAEDVRRKARFQAVATGLARDNGASSASHGEKKKADHTPHDHTHELGRVAVPCPSALGLFCAIRPNSMLSLSRLSLRAA